MSTAETREAAWSESTVRRSALLTTGFCRSFHLVALASTLIFGGEAVCHAAAAMPADARVGLFYAITHLHPLAYFILSLIVVLSVVNLVIQGWLSRDRWPLNRILQASGRPGLRFFGFWANRAPRRPRTDSSVSVVQGGPDYMGGVIGVPRPVGVPGSVGHVHPPTPLDGLNHPIPRLSNLVSTQTGAPRIVDNPAQKKSLTQDFRFSATVDVPSHEELERREKEQLVVSGSVTGPDGRGIASSIVYLTDQEGNRIGQSCRTQAETGEFKVLVNEPGTYFLNVYKRGYVLEYSDPMSLPIKSGKIEGYRVRMIPEGCVVQGRVTTQGGTRVVSDVQVTCSCKAKDYARSARTDSEGRFRLSGIPINSECYLEVVRHDGTAMVRSNTFETVQRKEIYQDLIIPVEAMEAPSGKPLPQEQVAGWTDEELEDEQSSAATSASA